MRLDKYSEKENNIKQVTNIDNIEKREKEWLSETEEAVEQYNEDIQKNGCFSDEHRRF